MRTAAFRRRCGAFKRPARLLAVYSWLAMRSARRASEFAAAAEASARAARG